jgi:hypothetical protein
MFLEEMAFPHVPTGEADQIRCNLHQAFGISLTFHLRRDCTSQIKLPGSEGKSITVSAFFNQDALRDIETVASRTSSTDENKCICSQCQSSFIGNSGRTIRTWTPLPDRPRLPMYSFMPVTVFNIEGGPQNIRAHYNSSFDFSIISANFARKLGHKLDTSGQTKSKKIINLNITVLSHSLVFLPQLLSYNAWWRRIFRSGRIFS